MWYNPLVYVSGKQVKLLYEPVAVRHVFDFSLPEVPQPLGQAIGDFREGEERSAESKYPDKTLLEKVCRECRRMMRGNTK